MGLLIFLERIIDSVLFGLNVTNHLFAQDVILSISDCILSAVSSGFLTTKNKLVSSANRLIFEFISTTMSFIYIKKRSGPRIEPCGTPADIELRSEELPGRTTLCWREDR